MTDEALLELATDIVLAHVSNNKVAVDELPVLIRSVYGSLAKLGETPEPVQEKREPAVSVRSSVKAESIACLECGSRMKLLKRHLQTEHGLTPAEYRSRWGLASDYPMVAPDYAAKRQALALEAGLGRKPAAAAAPAKPAPAAKPAAAPKAARGAAATKPVEDVAAPAAAQALETPEAPAAKAAPKKPRAPKAEPAAADSAAVEAPAPKRKPRAKAAP